ncbi:hypothetical protein BaRGS_00025673, partial [Batillaria attramentaria]
RADPSVTACEQRLVGSFSFSEFLNQRLIEAQGSERQVATEEGDALERSSKCNCCFVSRSGHLSTRKVFNSELSSH